MICPHCNVALPDGARFCNSCGNATAATEPHSSPDLKQNSMVGREIAGRYRLLALLGEGGMGSVFRAEQISLKRTVAVKLLRPDVSSNPMILRRFDAEATAVGKLSHPNTVNIYDFGRDTDGSLFIAMELIEGRSLRSVVATEAPLQIGRALVIASQVAASLSDAHSHQIIHRDLKPDNVMLQDRGREKDVVRVLDFGIAKLRDETQATQAALTKAGDVLGTPQYMAPEQIRGEAIDGRTDIYALGCMIYEMVTGRLPFEAATIMAIMSKHLMESCPPPSARRPDLRIPPAIDQLVMTAMAKDANARWQTMDVFGEHIAGVLASLPPDQRPQPKLSAGVSAAVAVPVSTPAAMAGGAVTPTAYSVAQPQMPHVTTPVPQHAAMPAAMPQSTPQHAPYPHNYAPPPYPTAPPAKNRTLMWVLISVAAIVSVGLIAWGVGGPKKDESLIKVTKGSGDPFGDDDNHDKHDTPDKPDKPDPPEHNVDPPPPPPPQHAGFPHLVVPAGWVELAPPSADGHAIQNVNVKTAVVMVVTLPAGSTVQQFIKAAEQKGSKLLKQDRVMSAGAMRDAYLFQGKVAGSQEQILEIIVTYQNNIIAVAQIPFSMAKDPAFVKLADEFFVNNVILP